MIIIKICTVNIPESYIEVIEKLIREDGLYPSRSELVRVATREYIIKELKRLKEQSCTSEPEIIEESTEMKKLVRVPLGNGEFREYKILKRLV